MAIAYTHIFQGTSSADHFVGGGMIDGSITPAVEYMMTADDFVTDTIDGSVGYDLIDYSRSQVGVAITLTDPVAAGAPSGGSVVAEFSYPLVNPFTGAVTSVTHIQTVATLTSVESANGSNLNDTLTGNSADNTLSGLAGNDVINGGGGVDQLYGGAGNDVINGGAGADFINGGAGRDILTGGLGADIFQFLQVSDSPVGAPDTITDFVRGQDKLDLTALVGQSTGPLTFVGASFTGHGGDVTSTFDGHGYLVQVDTNGDRRADFQLQVSSTSLAELQHPLQASDFLFHQAYAN
jgi:Ca2+-binding RTX toxin-like protein